MMRAKKRAFSSAGGLYRTAVAAEGGRRTGFAAEAGGLVTGGAFLPYEGKDGKYVFPAGCLPEEVYFLRTSSAFCAAAYAGGRMYVCLGDGGAFTASDVTFVRAPACVRAYGEGELLILSDGRSVCRFTREGLSSCAGIPPFTCAGYAYDRLWTAVGGGDACTVRFSAVMDIFDFDGGGSIDLPDGRGALLSFVNADNVFYLFRQYGIQKLTAKGREDEFILTDEDGSSERIFGGSVCAENGRMYFLCEGGLCAFGGSGVRRLYEGFSPVLVPGEGARAAVCGGKIFVSADFGGRHAVGVFRADGSDGYLLQAEGAGLVCAQAPGGLRVFSCEEGALCAYSEGAGSSASWEVSPPSPFGGEETVLEELLFSGEGDFAVEAESDRGMRRFEFVCRGTKRLRPALAGTRFSFSVLARGGRARVAGMTAGYSRRQ